MKILIACAMICCAVASAMVYSADAVATEKKKPAVATTQPTTKPVAAINKFCAVDRENPVDDSVPTITYKGKVIGFCCDDCPPKFRKNPELYMKDLK
ncbi:MAG TPA: hypothetical protein VG326_17755 [Tepidisphaeraceae bacterium]|jgi:YHS domain-containing protein|nr:hypothetical protein [Tepidisphaeraceae bacterium]